MSDHEKIVSWIGASLLRKEDARHLHGRGMFIADINMPGIQDIAFVRSQMAQRERAPSDQAFGISSARFHIGRHRPDQHSRGRTRTRRASP